MESKLKLTKCTEKYWEFVRIQRTDLKNIDGFIERGNITPEDQINYMTKHSHEYRICLLGEIPVGFVGSVNNDIRVCVAHKYKNKGIGKFMIKKAMKLWPNALAKVKIDNDASIMLFESCGYNLAFYIYKS